MGMVTEQNDPNARLSWKERIGYSIGALAGRYILCIVGTFLMVYMTNVAYIDIAVISTIIAVSKFFDGISDIIVGAIIDKSSSGLGKARVWLLRMCLPLAVSTLLLFYVPAGWPQMVKYIYVFLIYNLVHTVFLTFVLVAYGSLLAMMTGNSEEHGLIGNITAIFQGIAMLVPSVFFVKLLLVFTDIPGEQNTQRAYTGAVLCFMVLCVISLLITVFTTKERINDAGMPAKDKESLSASTLVSLKALVSHKYWILFLLCYGMNMICAQFASGCSAYFAMYVLGDINYISWLAGTTIFCGTLTQFFTPFMMKRWGKKWVFTIGAALSVIGHLGMALFLSVIPVMLAFGMIKGIGVGMVNGMLIGILADIISYTREKTGVFAAGIANAGFSAMDKAGQGIGSVILGFVMAWAGFDPLLKMQSPTVIRTINMFMTWAPGVIFLVILIIFWFFFDLDKYTDSPCR